MTLQPFIFLQNYLGVHFTINIGKITDNFYLRWFD